MANERARDLRKRMTPAEVLLWSALRLQKAQGLHFRRQVPMRGYIVDFACLRAKLAIEVDGEQHGLPQGLAHDADRDARLAAIGIRTLRFWNHEILRNRDGVVDTILAEIHPRLTHRTSGSASG